MPLNIQDTTFERLFKKLTYKPNMNMSVWYRRYTVTGTVIEIEQNLVEDLLFLQWRS